MGNTATQFVKAVFPGRGMACTSIGKEGFPYF